MENKICGLCKTSKPYSQYRMRSGNRSHQPHAYCKNCEKIYRKKYNKKYFASEQGKIARSKYFQSSKGKAMKASADKRYQQSEKGKAARYKAIEKYEQTEKGRISKRKSAKKQRKLYPKKTRAREAVSYQVRFKGMPKASELKCHHCERNADQYHHFNGYKKEHWLDVIPLCLLCHRKQHEQF